MDALKKPPPKIKIYTKYYCGWCREVTDYLNRLGWKYEELEVAKNPKNYKELVDFTGQEMAPTAFIDNRLLIDFGEDELDAFLKKEGYL
jgi:glutaredoxin